MAKRTIIVSERVSFFIVSMVWSEAYLLRVSKSALGIPAGWLTCVLGCAQLPGGADRLLRK